MGEFYVAQYEGCRDEVIKYLSKKFEDTVWDCPTGTENLEGMIDVLRAVDNDFLIEVDWCGNIRAKGSLETFANAIPEGA